MTTELIENEKYRFKTEEEVKDETELSNTLNFLIKLEPINRDEKLIYTGENRIEYSNKFYLFEDERGKIREILNPHMKLKRIKNNIESPIKKGIRLTNLKR